MKARIANTYAAWLGVVLLFTAVMAQAAAIESGTVTFENADTPPLYFKATVAYQIFAPGDASSPLPSATDYTYVYILTNENVTPPSGQFNIPLGRIEIGLASNASVSQATSIGTGVVPSAIDTSSPAKVRIEFATFIQPGESSQQLILHSRSGPGDAVSTIGFGGSVDDQILRGPFGLAKAALACFDVNKVYVKLDRDHPNDDKIKIEKGVLSFAPGQSFDPTSDSVTLDLNSGAVSLTIPAGSFEQKGTLQDYRYKTGSNVVPKVHARINVDKGEWEVKIDNIDASALDTATALDITLIVGGVNGQVSVPLTVKSEGINKKRLKFKRSPKVECVAEDLLSKRSCLSSIEVTYLYGQPDEEVIRVFSDDIGHPETTFVTATGASATFHTSCSQCLQCGDIDDSGNFTITGLSDASEKMIKQCGIDPSCDSTP